MKKVKKTLSKKQTEEKTKQLDLGMKEPLKNKIYKVKTKTEIALLQLEVRKFLKDIFFWFVTSIGFVMVAQQVWNIQNHYNLLPNLIPILGYNMETAQKLIDKGYIYIFPALSLTALILGIFLSARYYNREKMLTKYVLLGTLLICVSQSVILLQLIKNF